MNAPKTAKRTNSHLALLEILVTRLIDDTDHSNDEDRFVLLGLSSPLKVVLVCHCYRDEGNVIRIISARKASPQESKHNR